MKKLMIFFLCWFFLSCDKGNNDKWNCENAHLWDYPLIQGTDEEKANAYQIPENILLCFSTDELTDLCLRYPLLENRLSFGLLDEGLDRLFAEFNGIRALFARADVASTLLKRYNEKISNLPLQESDFILDALLSRIEEQDDKILKEILCSLFTGYDAISMLEVDKELLLQYNFFSRAHVIIKISDEYLTDIPLGKGNPIFTPTGADSLTTAIINRLSNRLCYCNQEEADPWEYPEIPTEITDEWNNPFLYAPPVVEELQIPENVLYCLSTKKLVDLSLQFPFIRNYFCSLVWTGEKNSCYRYSIILDYNGISELFARKDAAYWLLKRYNEEIQSYIGKGGWFADNYNPRFSYLAPIEIMLTYVKWQDDENLKEILRNLVAGYETVLTKYEDSLSANVNMFISYWARGNIINKICHQCIPNDDDFFGPYYFPSEFHFNSEIAVIINQLSYQLIK